jgi:hypothetical protein
MSNSVRNTAVGRNLALQAATGELVLNFSGHAVAHPQLVSVLVTSWLHSRPTWLA